MKKTPRTRELTNSFCIIERGQNAPLCLSMDTAARRRDAHIMARQLLGLSLEDSLDVWQGDPNGEGEEAPVLIGQYARTKGFVAAATTKDFAPQNTPLERAADAIRKDRERLIRKELADADTLPEKNVRSLLKFYIRQAEQAYQARDAARAEVAALKEAQAAYDAGAALGEEIADALLQEFEETPAIDGAALRSAKGVPPVSDQELLSRLGFVLNELRKDPADRKKSADMAIISLRHCGL